MSKNKHGDLFNTSLTEIIIILFFVLMLFAIFNINKVNQSNVSLEDEVDNLITQKVDLENMNSDLQDEKDTLILIIEADNEPSPLGPINVELALQITELKQDKRRLENEIKRLTPEDNTTETEGEPPTDSLIAGNCIDKKFWRQCADWAWPIEVERAPPVEFLFDIGMCSAGDIVVIKSNWERKRETDFDMVDGASTITNKMYIKRNEIIEFMSLIHDKSLDFKEGQAQHVARLINLELIDTDISKFPRKAIGDEMNFIPTTRFEKKYEAIKSRFPENACDTFNQMNKVQPDGSKKIKDDITGLDIIDSLIIPKTSSQDISKNKKDNISGPDTTDSFIAPKTSSQKALFKWDKVVNCRRARGKRNPEFNATFDILITDQNRARVQSYTFDDTNSNNRLVTIDAKSTIQKLRKNIKKVSSTDNPDDNNIIYTVRFAKDICRNVY